MTRHQEGRLVFDFSAARSVDKLDAPRRTLPYKMAFVDFVVEEETQVLLVEVKDPEAAPPDRREREIARFIDQLRKAKLVNEVLVPKARDSYTYLHLMCRDDKPFVYVVVLGIGPGDPELLMDLKHRLLARLRQEADEPWKRQYVRDCIVVTPQTWKELLGDYPLTVRQT